MVEIDKSTERDKTNKESIKLFTNKPKEKKKIECDNEDNQAVKILKESDIKKPKISRPKTQSTFRNKNIKDDTEDKSSVEKLDDDKQKKT